MYLSDVFAALAFLPWVFGAATTVRKTDEDPTGYVIDFVFTPNTTTSPSFVLLGGFPLYSDSLHASPSKTDDYSPWKWKPDDFGMVLFTDLGNPATMAGLNMTLNTKTGDWELTVPFPSGTFSYAYHPDCSATTWSACPTIVVDFSNPPIELYLGDQNLSIVQVPFGAKYQVNNYDWQLPLPMASQRGDISFHNYPSPNSTYPFPNIHDVGVYLPHEYGTIKGKQYPVLYLSHGGGGTDSDWFNQGRAHNILDRLIAGGEVEPMIVVTPNFYNLGFILEQYATNTTVEGFDVVGLNAFFNAVLENYLSYLIPWVEKTYSVVPSPSGRAFAGLSLGGGLTITMLFNATAEFSSFCVMSNTPSPEPGDSQYNNSGLRDVGVFLGAGFYDVAFTNSQNMQARLSEVGINYLSHYPLNGAHQWSTWQQILYEYLRYGIWKKTPYDFGVGDNQVETFSGGVPYKRGA